jgi:hypothetical protein
MSLEKITSHEPTAVKRDPEDIKEGIAESAAESRESLPNTVQALMLFYSHLYGIHTYKC